MQNGGTALAGEKIAEFLSLPEVQQKAKDDKEFNLKYREAVGNLYTHYPDYAKKVVAQKLSQFIEDNGGNNGILNFRSKAETDKLAEQSLQPYELSVYKKDIRPFIGMPESIGNAAQRVFKAFEGDDTGTVVAPSFVESAFQSGGDYAEGGLTGMKNLVGISGSEKHQLASVLQKDATHVTVDPVGFLHTLANVGGNTAGFVATMGLSGAMGKGLELGNLPHAVSNMLAFGSMKYRKGNI